MSAFVAWRTKANQIVKMFELSALVSVGKVVNVRHSTLAAISAAEVITEVHRPSNPAPVATQQVFLIFRFPAHRRFDIRFYDNALPQSPAAQSPLDAVSIQLLRSQAPRVLTRTCSLVQCGQIC